MKQFRGKAATIVTGVWVAAVLIVVPSAQAAVTTSTVTTPKDATYLLYNTDTPNTIAISGTSNGNVSDHVDLVCYAGDKHPVVAANVAVNSNGTFSAPAADLSKANLYRTCNLKAVPAGTSPGTLTSFTGPRLYVGDSSTSHVKSGPNTGTLYDYYLYFQQSHGGLDYDSLGGCGVDDGYLLDPTNALTAVTWYCNGWLDRGDENANPTRSEVRIDGVDAYTADGAQNINDAATGFPKLTYSYSQNSKTGNSVIHEKDAFVKCATPGYPPVCDSFKATGVMDTRAMTQDHGGKVAWITDVFTSTNGKAHTLDLLWQNDQHFYGDAGGDATQVEYKFPGQSGYSLHSLDDVIKLPKQPGTILVRYHGAADGDVNHGRGAIVYSEPATAAKFMNITKNQSDFTLHQTINVPAHGSVTLRWAYIADFHQATVDALAKKATVVVAGCTVPNVVGETLRTAKRAILHAHCAVGKISHAHSAKVAAGTVIAERPKAGSNVDYGSKIALVVSKG